MRSMIAPIKSSRSTFTLYIVERNWRQRSFFREPFSFKTIQTSTHSTDESRCDQVSGEASLQADPLARDGSIFRPITRE